MSQSEGLENNEPDGCVGGIVNKTLFGRNRRSYGLTTVESGGGMSEREHCVPDMCTLDVKGLRNDRPKD